MKFTFTMGEEDFLTNLLYTASTSKVIINRRKKTRFLVPILYILFGIFNLPNHEGIAITLFAFAILWVLFYPIRERKRYIGFYKKHIKDYFGTRLGKPCSFELENDFLLLKEGDSESRISIEEVESIIELPAAIIIKLKFGTALSLPKAKISGIEELKNILKKLAKKLNIVYMDEPDWVWR